METVILCGGTGTRLKEMTEFCPKPLVPIGGKPIIYHIMKTFSHYGFTDFILALGYKQDAFKEYFAHFDEINNDVVMHVGRYQGQTHREETADNWRIILSDTGLHTLKGGRLKKVQRYVRGDTFFLTYGDGVSDINLKELLAFHEAHGKMVTITGVHPPARFGEIHHEGSVVTTYSEKPQQTEMLVSAGYYVCNKQIFGYLTEDGDLEKGPLEKIAAMDEMRVYHHKGFWKPMDTLNDMMQLEILWEKGAPWKTW